MRPLPWLIAHRGAMAEAPENVEAAFDLAFSYPVDGIEFDVQMTADYIPVIFHDDDLHRITGKYSAVADLNISELRELDFGKWFSENFRGQQLMTLESLLKRYSGKGILMIELKSGGGRRNAADYRHRLCRETARLIDLHITRGLQDEVFVLSFEPEMIKDSLEFSPHLKHILNLKKPLSPHGKNPPVIEKVWGCCVPRRNLRPDYAGFCHDRGLYVAVYSCNTPGQVRSAMNAGADVIMTDDPARAKEAFQGTMYGIAERDGFVKSF